MDGLWVRPSGWKSALTWPKPGKVIFQTDVGPGGHEADN